MQVPKAVPEVRAKAATAGIWCVMNLLITSWPLSDSAAERCPLASGPWTETVDAHFLIISVRPVILCSLLPYNAFVSAACSADLRRVRCIGGG